MHIGKCIKYVHGLKNNIQANTHLTTTQVKIKNIVCNKNPQCAFVSP